MPNLFKPPADSAGFDAGRNLFVMPQNRTATFWLVAGQGLAVDSTDASVFSANAGTDDVKSAHKLAGLSGWESQQNLRRIDIKSGNKVGSAKLRARDGAGRDQILPLDVFVVTDGNSRRVTDGSATEPTLQRELDKLTLREAVLRIVDDQLCSNVKTTAQGCSLYHLDPAYGNQWCGAFAFWCWQQAARAKGVTNPFNSQNDLLSPQKVIAWGMRDDSAGQLLQYGGPNPMTMKGDPQALREVGYNGYQIEPGDIACWRAGHAMGFKHVSLVERVSGSGFVDLNGNAYDAGSGSAIARITHPNMKQKLPDGAYQCFFLHVLV